jgi:hypothetical protein
MTPVGQRTVFRPRIDTLMLHLAHPLVQKATGSLTRRRFPGPSAVSRWTVRLGAVPSDADALLFLHVEELAVNDLRESFHHWVRTYRIPVAKGKLGQRRMHWTARMHMLLLSEYESLWWQTCFMTWVLRTTSCWRFSGGSESFSIGCKSLWRSDFCTEDSYG